jgi:nucleoid DNA-binding protein
MNKGDLVEKLRKRGLSRRNAVLILNFILDEMAAALKHGEEVEFPFGSLKRVRHAHKQQQGRFLNRNTTIYKNRGIGLLIDSRDLVQKTCTPGSA